jgi:hypothetical protein
VNTCPSCRWSRSHGILNNRKDWRCYQPDVNRLRPAFLAGNPQSATSCFSERMNVVGKCGTKGRKWESRRDSPPATLIDEPWEQDNEPAALEVPAPPKPGGESVLVDSADSAGAASSSENASSPAQSASESEGTAGSAAGTAPAPAEVITAP